MKATLLVVTDGRADCLAQALAAFDLCVDEGLIERRVIVDDSADRDYAAWIDHNFRFDQRASSEERRGFGGAIQAGWDLLGNAEFVFHLEDDFVLARHVPLASMMETLARRSYLAQMALRRQPWGPDEVIAGGYIERDPYAFTNCWDTERPERRWMEHRKFFTTNPSVYPAWVAKQGWPQVPGSEGQFGLQLFQNPQVRCAIWGNRHDPPWAIHIGHKRVGTGY